VSPNVRAGFLVFGSRVAALLKGARLRNVGRALHEASKKARKGSVPVFVISVLAACGTTSGVRTGAQPPPPTSLAAQISVAVPSVPTASPPATTELPRAIQQLGFVGLDHRDETHDPGVSAITLLTPSGARTAAVLVTNHTNNTLCSIGPKIVRYPSQIRPGELGVLTGARFEPLAPSDIRVEVCSSPSQEVRDLEIRREPTMPPGTREPVIDGRYKEDSALTIAEGLEAYSVQNKTRGNMTDVVAVLVDPAQRFAAIGRRAVPRFGQLESGTSTGTLDAVDHSAELFYFAFPTDVVERLPAASEVLAFGLPLYAA
jgi:hypothetical protein